MSYGREDVAETRTPTVSSVREPEPPRDYLAESLRIIEEHFYSIHGRLVPVAERDHLLALWALLPSDVKKVIRMRARGEL